MQGALNAGAVIPANRTKPFNDPLQVIAADRQIAEILTAIGVTAAGKRPRSSTTSSKSARRSGAAKQTCKRSGSSTNKRSKSSVMHCSLTVIDGCRGGTFSNKVQHPAPCLGSSSFRPAQGG